MPRVSTTATVLSQSMVLRIGFWTAMSSPAIGLIPRLFRTRAFCKLQLLGTRNSQPRTLNRRFKKPGPMTRRRDGPVMPRQPWDTGHGQRLGATTASERSYADDDTASRTPVSPVPVSRLMVQSNEDAQGARPALPRRGVGSGPGLGAVIPMYAKTAENLGKSYEFFPRTGPYTHFLLKLIRKM